MDKRKGFQPMIFLSSSNGDDIVIGPGSGQTNTDPYPCSFADWQTMFEYDNDFDGSITMNDYGLWWASMGFSQELWEYYNPDTPWDPSWGAAP